MFNEIDDEQARPVCVIGTATRDELFGSPEQMGYDYNPVGEQINIKDQPFTIIGMFQRCESEQDRKARELSKLNARAATLRPTGPRGASGWGGRRGGSFVFTLKNNTIYIPAPTP